MPPIVDGIYKAVTSHMDMPLTCPIEPSVSETIWLVGSNVVPSNWRVTVKSRKSKFEWDSIGSFQLLRKEY